MFSFLSFPRISFSDLLSRGNPNRLLLPVPLSINLRLPWYLYSKTTLIFYQGIDGAKSRFSFYQTQRRLALISDEVVRKARRPCISRHRRSQSIQELRYACHVCLLCFVLVLFVFRYCCDCYYCRCRRRCGCGCCRSGVVLLLFLVLLSYDVIVVVGILIVFVSSFPLSLSLLSLLLLIMLPLLSVFFVYCRTRSPYCY